MDKKHKAAKEIQGSDVEAFDKLRAQMKQLAADVELLSKKSPDGPVSKFKLGFINEKIRDANRFLQPPFKPVEGFEQFDDVALPSNSDVVLVVAQYLTCLERWRSANVHYEKSEYGLGNWYWDVKGEEIRAEPSTGVRRVGEGSDFDE